MDNHPAISDKVYVQYRSMADYRSSRHGKVMLVFKDSKGGLWMNVEFEYGGVDVVPVSAYRRETWKDGSFWTNECKHASQCGSDRQPCKIEKGV